MAQGRFQIAGRPNARMAGPNIQYSRPALASVVSESNEQPAILIIDALLSL